MAIHVPLADKVLDTTGRTMLLFDLAAGPNEFAQADAILAAEFPGAVTQGFDSTSSKYPEFRITIVPYAFDLVRSAGARRKLWPTGVISIDPERAARPPRTMISASGQAFDVITALGLGSTHHGAGINVAVLDTGIAKDHADFLGRTVRAEGVGLLKNDDYDDHGHGTHCIGLACGPRNYGIADASNILAGRIYSADMSPTEGQVLEGFRWACTHGADIVTLSLNWRGFVPEPSPQLERAGRLMLDAGILVIASGAAGSGEVTPPANCNSIMAIGSVGSAGKRSKFSPIMVGGRDPVDAVAYGERIQSSCLYPEGCIYSGNSMAAAAAGGIAALWAGSNGTYRGAKLWEVMIDAATTTTLVAPTFRTVGAGLLVPPP